MISSKKNANLIYRLSFSVIILACIIMLGSCKKYLNTQPVSGSLPSVVFSTVTTTQQALLGAYNELAGDQGYGIRLSLYYTQSNDETMGPANPDDKDRRGISNYHVTPDNAQLESPFDQLYSGIENANLCIYYIPKSIKYSDGNPSDTLQMHRMYGEALALRAQYYLELIRNWGDVPAPFIPSFLQSNIYLPRMDRDSIYDHLLDDLALAETLVPWRGETDGQQIVGANERFSKGAIKGLRARIALYRGGYSLRSNLQMVRGSDYLKYYQIAHDECLDIINSGHHALNPSYKSVFKDFICAEKVDNTYGEIMFEVGMGGGAPSGVDSKLGYYNGPKFGGGGNASLFILPTYFYSFDSTDLRRDVTSAPYDANADYTKVGQKITSIRDGKFRQDWITPPVVVGVQYFGVDWPVLRYSDVLLMYAEAQNELNNGPDATALEAVNQVRRRGYGYSFSTPNPTVDLHSGLGKNDFFTALVKERSLELGAEGIRKYDLIRWDSLASKIKTTQTLLAAIGSATPPPPYNNYPTSMFMYTAGTAGNPSGQANAFDDARLWASSFYEPTLSSTPTGTSKIAWIGSGILNTFVTPSGTFQGFAGYFIPNKCELFPTPQHSQDANPSLTVDPYGYH